jgi:hypothetical protein
MLSFIGNVVLECLTIVNGNLRSHCSLFHFLDLLECLSALTSSIQLARLYFFYSHHQISTRVSIDVRDGIDGNFLLLMGTEQDTRQHLAHGLQPPEDLFPRLNYPTRCFSGSGPGSLLQYSCSSSALSDLP